MQYNYIGAAVGVFAGTSGCELAPDVIRTHLNLNDAWQQTVYHQHDKATDELGSLVDFSTSLAKVTQFLLASGKKFITFGGDHSCAIGTWSGVAEEHGEFGLIWIDAHMDAHTEHTTPSGNVHGMPVACLLGHGDPKLTRILSKNPKIKPENIVLLGIRCYEPEEADLLDSLGVTVHKIEEVHSKGFSNLMQQAIDRFVSRGLKFGISLDLDGLDPEHISALGTPVANGIRLDDVTNSLSNLDMQQVIGLEITEYNPTLDKQDYPGLSVINKLLESLPKLARVKQPLENETSTTQLEY